MPGWTIVFALGFLVDVLLGHELVVTPVGDTIEKALNRSMVLTCSLSPTNGESIPSNFSLHWILPSNDEATTTSGRIYVETSDNKKKLYVTRIQESDAGKYECRSKIAGNWLHKPIELIVFKDITFNDAPFVQNPAIDTDALIRCKVSSTSTPQVSWLYKDRKIDYGERFVKEADGLRIYGIKESDNGNYTCRVETADGRFAQRKIQVIVHIPPKITLPMNDSVGVQGKDLTMSCKASGLPSPLYEFFKDESSKPIVSTNRIHVDNTTGDIHFNPLDRLDDGRYTCRASNSAGSVATIGGLRVLVPPTIEPLNDVTVSEGEAATIECRSNGDPTPKVTFHRMDKRLDYDIGEYDNGRIIVTSPTSGQLVLSISKTGPSDSGNYTCRASSTSGSDVRTGTLKVEFRPRFHENQTGVVYIWAGKKRSMTCRVSSEPEATIEWLHSGIVLTNNETFVVYHLGETSYLEVSVREEDQSWIYGQYVCRATNKLGQIETVISLKRATHPDAPELVELVAAHPTSVILRAMPPKEDGGIEVLGYRVEYDDKVQDFSLGDEIRIDHLRPSTTYKFLVRARNEVGSGRGVEISVSTTANSQPNAAKRKSLPLGAKANGYSENWKSPITGGSPIKKFNFRYKKVSVEKGSFNNVILVNP